MRATLQGREILVKKPVHEFAIDSAALTFESVPVPPDVDDWFTITDVELPIAASYEWAVRPHCGAVVLFSGTVRDSAPGRDDVDHLTYEAYEEQVVPVFESITAELRRRWPDTGRVALDLERAGVVVRSFGDEGIRVTIGTRAENDRFLTALAGVSPTG